VIDAEGNVVSNTYTLNFSFGSGIAVPGAGFFLNNEMDDFSVKPGVPTCSG
jgi:gamma-glutamyltranspeptidase/glutathione hydrolase